MRAAAEKALSNAIHSLKVILLTEKIEFDKKYLMMSKHIKIDFKDENNRNQFYFYLGQYNILNSLREVL